ncbi:MAG TPA: hypothetical protein PKD52_04795 [Clostridiales bacterium]|nr:hypothetical protein [Clostridiales bacterium]
MSAPRDQLIDALCRRQDQEALALIKENPTLLDHYHDHDEEIIRLALDHGCVRVIRYLRQENKITMEGKEIRDLQRVNEFNDKISRFNKDFADIEKYLK